MPKYRETVYKNVRNQLRLMNMASEASHQSLKAHPIRCDKLVDDNVYISTLNTKALKEILNTISYLIRAPEPNQQNIWIYPITGLALLSSFLILRKILKS